MTQVDGQYNKFSAIIQDIHRLTTFHGDLGLEYQQSTGLHQLFEKQPSPRTQQGAPYAQPTSPTRPQAKKKAPAKKATPPAIIISKTDINNCKQLISECNSCPHKKPPKFGIGTTNQPFILIICDRNSTDPSRPMEEAEESLLGKMLQAIKIKPSQVFVTNLIKCNVGNPPPQTTLEMATNCLSHTAQQIRLMQPHLICTMGQLSSQLMLNSKNQLMALRGHFHTYMDIPLMATYHPAQLLALPELKKATWFDLQLMQRRLAMGK